MSVSGTITVTISPTVTPSWLFSTLWNSGWKTENCLVYEVFKELEGIGDYLNAPVDKLPEILGMFDTAVASGSNVAMWLNFEGEALIHVHMTSGQILINFDGGRRTLLGSRFTDFTWYLQRIIPAFEGSGILVNAVLCHDSM